MKGALGLLLFFSLLLIAAPLGMNLSGHGLGGMSTSVMVMFGIGLLLVSGTLLIITQLYVKTRADEAFVRTGMGKLKVVMDGGSVVIPVIHEKVPVPLRTFRIVVQRVGAEALLTLDKLRADVKAEFFVRILPEEKDITNAARSLGASRTEHEETIRQLIEDKLISALRTVAATKSLEELNSKREDFVKAVTEFVAGDLKHNGFTLETTTISALDQADAKTLRDDNVFDAEGKLTIATITEAKRTERNAIERAREQERREQDVTTRKKILEFDQAQAQAEAEQASNIAQIRAQQQQTAQTKEIEAARQVSLSDVERTQKIEVAKREQEQAVEVAERKKLQAVTVAERDVEVAKREADQAVAEAERQRALAEAKRAEAEAERETARQAVKTVEVQAGAERDKKQRVIAAEAAAETQFVTAKRAADASAYEVTAQAEAKKAAADAEAMAIRTRAEADAAAKKQQADGDQAVAMVPVNVASAQVAVDQKRVVEVTVPDLKAKQDFGKAAIDLQIQLAIIEAEKEARIASAKAMGESLQRANMTFWGTPDQVKQITERFVNGQSIAHAMNGFTGSLGSDGHSMLASIGAVVKAVAEKLGGGADEAVIEAAVRGALAKQHGGGSPARS